jgi:hypothetical protein
MEPDAGVEELAPGLVRTDPAGGARAHQALSSIGDASATLTRRGGHV